MIIDVHHHMIPLTFDERTVTLQAERIYAAYGGGARSGGVNVTVEEIKQGLSSYAPDPDGQKLLERMTQAGIHITILCVVDSVGGGLADEDMMAANRACAAVADKSSGKIIAMAGIDPRRKTAPELYRRCVEEYGMKGLKWHPDSGYYPNSEEAYAVLKVAEELGTPLLTHTGPLPSPRASQAMPRARFASAILLDEVAQDFPDLNIVAAHMGRHAWRDWASLAEFRRNLYGDLAMWQTFAVTSYERFCRYLREILDIAGQNSVLFGSDCPVFTALVPNEQFFQIIRDLPQKAPPGINFTQEEVDCILGENARKVFGL